MDIIKKNQLIADLVRRCIGERTLDEACAATGLSRNRLHRLRNGDFTRMPSDEVIMALTADSAEPQNGVSYSDFAEILNDDLQENGHRKIKTQITEIVIDCVVWRWLLSLGDVTIYNNKKDAMRYDLIASVNNIKYYFEYKVVFKDPVNQSYLSRIKMDLITRIATSTVDENDVFAIATNSEQLLTAMKDITLNVKPKVIILLIDNDIDKVKEVIELTQKK